MYISNESRLCPLSHCSCVDIQPTAVDVNQPAYYGLVSNVVGRTPDLVIVPRAGVVFASPGKKLSEHGGLMQPDVNVALMVYAPKLATAGTVYNATVGPSTSAVMPLQNHNVYPGSIICCTYNSSMCVQCYIFVKRL